MPLLVNSVPNLAQGVSQQPDNLRYPGQCDEQINAWATVVEGLKKRPNTNYVKNLDSSSTSSNLFTHFVKRDETDQYVLTVSLGGVGVTDLADGTKMSVFVTSIANSYLDLNGASIGSVTNPLSDLRALTVADYTFLVNKKKIVRPKADIESPQPSTEALIAVKLGDYEKAYTVYIDDVLIPVATSLNSRHDYSHSTHNIQEATYISGPADTAPKGLHADTEFIAKDLAACIEEESGTLRTGIGDLTLVDGGANWLDLNNNLAVRILSHKSKSWGNSRNHYKDVYITKEYQTKLEFEILQDVGGVENRSAIGFCKVSNNEIVDFVFTNRGSGYDTDTTTYPLELVLKQKAYLSTKYATGWQLCKNLGTAPTAPTVSGLSTASLSPLIVERDGSLIRVQKTLVVSNGGSYYILKEEHLSNSQTEPGTGADWKLYWKLTTSVSAGATAWAAGENYFFTEDIKVRTEDGLANQGLDVIYKEVNSITELPAKCYNGFKIKVIGDADISQDDYYVQFKTKDRGDFGEGSWVEVAGWRMDDSETSFFKGLPVQLDPTTMPLTLVPVFTATGDLESFKLQTPQEDEKVDPPDETGWRTRQAGDDYSNPMPSFVSTDGDFVSLGGSIYTCIQSHLSTASIRPDDANSKYWRKVSNETTTSAVAWAAGEEFTQGVFKTINDVFFFKNRLGFVTDSAVIFSEADAYFNFFRTTTQQLLDSAPIDVGLSHTKVAVLQHAIPFQEKLMLFSKQSQFVLRGADVLSPKTVAISPVTEFDISDSVEPVALGNYIYFTFKRNDFEGLYEYFVDNNTEVFDAEEVTQQVPKYIPNNVRKIAGSQAENTLVISVDDPKDPTNTLKTLYVYKYFWSNKEKIQSAWMKFSFDRDVVGFDFIDSKLHMITKDTEGLHLEFLTLEDGLKDEGLDYPLLLDSRIDGTELTVSYSATTKKSTISGFKYDPADKVEVYSKIGHKYDFTRTSATEGEVTGDITAVPFVAGVPYTMTYRFSNQSLKQPTERGGRSASDYTFQTIRNGSINYADTGHFVVEVTPKYRDTYKYVFNPDIVGANLLLNEFTPQDGHFRFAVQGQPDDVTIEVKSESALPCKLLAAEFESLFVPRSRRYGS